MGYVFTFEHAASDGDCGFNFNAWQMGLVREVMREAGAAAQDGLTQAMSLPGLETTEQPVDMGKFLSNGGQHVTADEARFIASRLRLALQHDVPFHLASFYDDAPPIADFDRWIEEFAHFNERSAAHDGYRVT